MPKKQRDAATPAQAKETRDVASTKSVEKGTLKSDGGIASDKTIAGSGITKTTEATVQGINANDVRPSSAPAGQTRQSRPAAKPKPRSQSAQKSRTPIDSSQNQWVSKTSSSPAKSMGVQDLSVQDLSANGRPTSAPAEMSSRLGSSVKSEDNGQVTAKAKTGFQPIEPLWENLGKGEIEGGQTESKTPIDSVSDRQPSKASETKSMGVQDAPKKNLDKGEVNLTGVRELFNEPKENNGLDDLTGVREVFSIPEDIESSDNTVADAEVANTVSEPVETATTIPKAPPPPPLPEEKSKTRIDSVSDLQMSKVSETKSMGVQDFTTGENTVATRAGKETNTAAKAASEPVETATNTIPKAPPPPPLPEEKSKTPIDSISDQQMSETSDPKSMGVQDFTTGTVATEAAEETNTAAKAASEPVETATNTIPKAPPPPPLPEEKSKTPIDSVSDQQVSETSDPKSIVVQDFTTGAAEAVEETVTEARASSEPVETTTNTIPKAPPPPPLPEEKSKTPIDSVSDQQLSETSDPKSMGVQDFTTGDSIVATEAAEETNTAAKTASEPVETTTNTISKAPPPPPPPPLPEEKSKTPIDSISDQQMSETSGPKSMGVQDIPERSLDKGEVDLTGVRELFNEPKENNGLDDLTGVRELFTEAEDGIQSSDSTVANAEVANTVSEPVATAANMIPKSWLKSWTSTDFDSGASDIC